MIQELFIENFAIIEKQQVSFHGGLNVISGETGAGKSVVLQAIELLLGARAKGQMIRTGAEEWKLQALFDLRSLSPEERSQFPDCVDDDDLVVSRTMTQDGKGRVYVNGELATVGLLEKIMKRLINVCGQGHHIQLLEPAYHLELIDRAGGLLEQRAQYQRCYQEWATLHKEVADAEALREEHERKRSELEFIVEELSGLTLYEGRREELEASVKRGGGHEKILGLGEQLTELVDGEQGLSALLTLVNRDVAQMRRYDDSVAILEEPAVLMQDAVQEFSTALHRYLSSLEIDEQTLEEQRDELALLARLSRKYSTDCKGLAALGEEAEASLAGLGDDRMLEKLRSERDEAATRMFKEAGQLRKKREKQAATLSKSVAKELGELNMPDARLEARWSDCEPTVLGTERVEFYISTNKGEELRPLRKVASGGELSRITLILKKLLNDRSGINVMVFDEVDTGISGKVARAVGEKLKELSENSQVICITHLPQVASLADAHLLVQKESGARTVSVIHELSESERVDEIARMLSGFSVTDASRESARELLAS